MKNVWKRLAEALGIETEANWDKAAKQRNMQRYGTMDRRDKQGPQAYFNTRGTGSAQRQGMAANATPNMTPRPGGLQIPSGTDRPGQGNPLVAPPGRKSPLGTAPNSPQGQSPQLATTQNAAPNDHGIQDDDWLDMLYGDDED